MTDPAVEAAKRARDKYRPEKVGIVGIVASEDAAREALKPIREWYEKLAHAYKDGCTGNALIVKGFLDDLAPLIYREDEL